VYSTDKKLRETCIPTAQTVLRGVAGLVDELNAFSSRCFGDVSRVSARLNLAYHQVSPHCLHFRSEKSHGELFWRETLTDVVYYTDNATVPLSPSSATARKLRTVLHSCFSTPDQRASPDIDRLLYTDDNNLVTATRP
jgi:hypothetical protein